MIPQRYIDHLRRSSIPYIRRPHRRAVGGQELAQALGVTGWRVAKTVLVEADDARRDRWMIVLPVPERVSLSRLSNILRVPELRLVPEQELAELFPDCELGAEPPFGSLYGLPVILDRRLAEHDAMLMRAGSHEESLAIPTDEYLRSERPKIATIGVLPGARETVLAEAR